MKNYKIQCKTMMGWMNLMGEFNSIHKAQEKIPWLHSMIEEGDEEVLRIVEVNENSINSGYLYRND
jgi:hypothetical protein